MAGQQLTGRREQQPTSTALGQRHADLALQGSYLHRHPRWRQVQRGRDSRNSAQAIEFGKHVKLSAVQHINKRYWLGQNKYIDVGPGADHSEGMQAMKVPLAAFAVVLLWASAFPAIRIAAPQLGVIGLSFVRLSIACVALLAVAVLKRVRLPAREDLLRIAGCGFFGMAAYQLLLNWGELFVPAGSASMIVAAAPLVSTAFAAGFLGERLGIHRVVGGVIALTGVALVCLSGSGLSLSAALWIIIAATIAQGIYHPLTKPLLQKYTGLEVATYAMVAGTLLMFPALPFGWSQIEQATVGGWWSALYLGLLPSALGFVLWAYAVARLPIATSTSLLYLVPVFAVVIAFGWLGEIPSLD